MLPQMTLTSDGTSCGTTLTDADGKKILNARSITLRIDAESGAVVAEIEAIFVGANVNIREGDAHLKLPWIMTLWPRMRAALNRLSIAIYKVRHGGLRGE
jgi:hypothetical protein